MMIYNEGNRMNLLQEGITNGAVIKTNRATKMVVDGLTDTYPIYQVRLDYLYFNDQNDRIATWISQYKSEHEEDSLNRDDLEHYNTVIQSFITKSNPERLSQTEKNIEMIGQQKYGVALNDGRIIDGNRRFSCLRNLSKKSNGFNYFETVILDRDYEHNAKQIKMLELQIQIGEEARVDYNPIDKLAGIYRDLVENKLLTIQEYARSTNMKENEVKKQLEYATLLVEFLESINAPGQFYIARDMDLNGPIVELYGILKKISNEDKKQRVKYITFANFLMKPAGDMTRFVRNLKKVAGSEFLDEFIESEEDISEEILDALPAPGSVTIDTVASVRADEKTRTRLEDTMEIISNKAKAIEAKSKPNQIILKAADTIETIDPMILKKLSKEQQEEMKCSVARLEKLIEGLREVLDV